MKEFIIDLSNIKSVAEAQNRFFEVLGITGEDIPLKEEHWDIFWDYFAHEISELTKGGEEVKLIIKNASELKKFGTLYPGTNKTHYEVLLEQLNDLTNPEKMFAHPSFAHPLNVSYELIEEKS
jgi:hypothetical protein